MATTIEHANHEDPKLLRNRVREIEQRIDAQLLRTQLGNSKAPPKDGVLQ